MYQHTIIFRIDRCILSEEGINDFLIEKIKDDSITYEYFGREIDNPIDFQHDEALNELIESTSYITFNFDTENEIHYSETDAKKYALNLLNENKVRILINEKDIEVFLD